MTYEGSVTLRAHAKLNLCLEVLRRREDGYHDLATIFQAIDLHDTLTVSIARGRGIDVHAEGWPVPEGRDNLCWLAAEVFCEAVPTLEGHISVGIHKALPPGGGLGGGSSDAAAVLVGLNHLTGEPLTDDGLIVEAARLGSDVAFLASGAGAALGTGRGEILTPLPCAACLPAVVTFPGEPVGTAWAYGLLAEADFTEGDRARSLAAKLAAGEPVLGDDGLGYNAFLEPVAGARPELREAMDELRDLGATTVSLAGSGACVWGVFADDDQARSAAETLTGRGRWASATGPAERGVALDDVAAR